MSKFNRFVNKNCKDLLYHGQGIVMIDKVLECSEDRVVVNANFKEDFKYLETLNNEIIFPTYKSIEMMAQSLGCYQYILLSIQDEFEHGKNNKEIVESSISNKKNIKIGFLLGVRKFEIIKPYVHYNQELFIKTILTIQNENGFGVYDSFIYINSFNDNNIIAKATLSVYSPEDNFLDNVRSNKEFKF